MKIQDLRDSVDGIHMKDRMRQEVVENVKGHTAGQEREALSHKRAVRERAPYRAVLTAVAVVAVIGAAAAPVRAVVNSLVRERMEEMDEGEKEAIVEQVESQRTEADSYSREYTANEKVRYQELAEKYKAGTFPEREVTQVETEEEAGQYEFCFIAPTAFFRLPDRELTDEEILEIIDFIVKRDYAYTRHYEEEHAREIAEKKEQEKEKIADNVESGGITQDRAIDAAQAKLYEIYSVTGDGMEFNCYYDEGGEEQQAAEPFYSINWTDIVSHQFYYFNISALDGRVMWSAHSGAGTDLPDPEIAEALRRLPSLQAQAVSFMEEKVKEPYEELYAYYLERGNGTAYQGVAFYFVKEEGGALRVKYDWDGTLRGYGERDLSGCEDGSTRELFLGGEKETMKVAFRKLQG